jgi:hypothetical protein
MHSQSIRDAFRSNSVTISFLAVRRAHQETWSATPFGLSPIARAAESPVPRSIHHCQDRRTQCRWRTSPANPGSTKVDFLRQHALVASLNALASKTSEDKHNSRARLAPPRRPATRIEIRSFPFAVKRATTARRSDHCNDAHVLIVLKKLRRQVILPGDDPSHEDSVTHHFSRPSRPYGVIRMSRRTPRKPAQRPLFSQSRSLRDCTYSEKFRIPHKHTPSHAWHLLPNACGARKRLQYRPSLLVLGH